MKKDKNENQVPLFKDLNEVKNQIDYWEKHEGVNWLGKWARSIRLERLYVRLASIQRKIQKSKSRGKK
jgi:hypothetical protein